MQHDPQTSHIPDQSYIKGFEQFDPETLKRLTETVRMDLYYHEVVAMPNHPYVSGCVFMAQLQLDTPVIQIAAHEPVWRRCRTYLHEACHLITGQAGLFEDPTGQAHNRFFGVLVAVCYRRVHALKSLYLYEFGDTLDVVNGEKTHANAKEISDTELIDRFRFIIHLSAHYAKTDWSIERIARDLAKRYFREDGSYREPAPKPVHQPSKRRSPMPAWLALPASVCVVSALILGVWYCGILNRFV